MLNNLEFEPVLYQGNRQFAKTVFNGVTIWEITIFPNLFDYKTPVRVFYDIYGLFGAEKEPEFDYQIIDDWDDDGEYWYRFSDLEKVCQFIKQYYSAIDSGQITC